MDEIHQEPLPVRILLEGEEEVSSLTSETVREHRDLLAADLV